MADGHGRHTEETPPAGPSAGPSTGPAGGLIAETAERAENAVAQAALEASLQAEREHAAERARTDSAAKALAAKRKAAAAAARAKAAKARATAAAIAASRSAKRAPLTASSGSSAPAASSSKVDRLISFLKAQTGKPYVYGATGPSSYDCSGLTQTAYATIGVSLPRTSQEQSTVGTPVSLGSLQPGDLVFWGGEGSAYHVGVYIGDGNYLDAANPSTPVGIKPLTYSPPDWAVRVL